MFGTWVQNRLDERVTVRKGTKPKYTVREALGFVEEKKYGSFEQLVLTFGSTAHHVN
jgi:hypothetical protein